MKNKVLGIIAEYNPFHNGHKYHIEKAKELTGTDYVVIIMSGNFLQRGEPAVIDKYSRTEMALNSGADLIIELPVCFSCSSAEYFAYAAVSLLDKMGCIDYLCFGCETPDITVLEHIANTLLKEPAEYTLLLKNYLSQGFSFPKARALSLKEYFNKNTDFDIDETVLDSPNNILAIEYIKALKYFNSSIAPIAIARTDAGYHSTDITSGISSATAIRNHLLNSVSEVSHAIPTATKNILTDSYNKSFPIWTNDFSALLKYRLLLDTEYDSFFDISAEFSNSIKKYVCNFDSFEALATLLKNKSYTLTKINRCLMHILLNLKTSDVAQFIEHNYCQYLRILGFKKETDLLKLVKTKSSVPLITKVADAEKYLDNLGMSMLNYDIFASNLYNIIVEEKFNTKIKNDYTHPLIIK